MDKNYTDKQLKEIIKKYQAKPKLFDKLKPVTKPIKGKMYIGFQLNCDNLILVGKCINVSPDERDCNIKGFYYSSDSYVNSEIISCSSWSCNNYNDDKIFGANMEEGTLYELKPVIPSQFKEVKE